MKVKSYVSSKRKTRESINIRGLFKWLYPGLGIKRWMLLTALGITLVSIGAVRALSNLGLFVKASGLIFLLAGIVLSIVGVRWMVKSIINIFIPQRERELVDIVYRKRYLERGPKIVAIGGGTGLSVLLHGLKDLTSNISAIVTVADDGGSSGRLREQFNNLLPPGDIRNCLVALADAEPLMRDLFQFRFDEGTELAGHSFGNLFIAAMSKVTGDFEKAVKASSKVLAIRGQVLPSTLNRIILLAESQDKTVTRGQARINKIMSPIKKVSLEPSDCTPNPEALKAIEEADALVLGPGSLFTSVIPNLLIPNMADAIYASKAIKIYVCNVMTEFRETYNFTASDHVTAIIGHTRPDIIDFCIVNTALVPDDLLVKYRGERAHPVRVDMDSLSAIGSRVITGELINPANYVRHDSKKVAQVIMDITMESKYRGV